MNDKSSISPAFGLSIYLGTKEVAYLLELKPQTIRKWLSNGTYPVDFPLPTIFNKRNRWRRKDIIDFIENKFSKSSVLNVSGGRYV